MSATKRQYEAALEGLQAQLIVIVRNADPRSEEWAWAFRNLTRVVKALEDLSQLEVER
jgi:hypothetical protein